MLSVIGQGYVGMPLALAAASAGHATVGIDLNPKIVSSVTSLHSPIEDISDAQIEVAYASGRYRITNTYESIKESEIVVICVPTPLDAAGLPDLTFLKAAVSEVSDNLKDGALVVIESTVAPGTTRDFVAPILDVANVGYELAYSPERIDPANKKWNVTNTPKLVAGITSSATHRASNFYQTFVSDVVQGSSVEVIETAKLLENSFRLINISFINEIAEICLKMKIDVREVIDAASTKPYGFMAFYPGAGVGGHCIPVDPSYLSSKAKEIGASARFIDLANQVNNELPDYFTKIAAKALGEIKNKNILIVGVAYKSDVSDIRETPALDLIRALRNAGAQVSWHDDLVQEWNGEKSAPLATTYDLAILVNPHTGTDLSKLGSVRILDTRGGYQ